MKSNKMLWGGAGVIAAAVVVYIAFFNPAPQETDLQGAIGAVQKHQQEQIKPEDVVLAGETVATGPDEAVVIEAISDLLGKAPVKEQAAFFRAATLDKQLAIYARADNLMKEAIWAEMSAKEKVDSFERIDKKIFNSVLERAAVKADWNAMSLDKQAAVLEKSANLNEKALMLDRRPKPKMVSIFGRIDDEKAAGLLGQASKLERATLVAAAPEANRQALLARMSANDYDAMVGRLSQKFTASSFERAVKDNPSLLLAQATDIDKAVLFGRASLDKQLEITGRGPEKENVAMMMAAAKPEELADLFGRALKPAEQVEVFERVDKELFKNVLQRAAVEDQWNAMTLDKKIAVLNRTNIEEKAALAGRAPYKKQLAMWNKAERVAKVAWLGRIDEARAAQLFGHATLSEQFELLGRAPEIQKGLMNQVSKMDATEMLMSRTFVNQSLGQ